MSNLIENKEIQTIFKRFKDNNYQIYIVGGAIRDYLLNQKIRDIDFTTDAQPDSINKLFDNTIEVGKRFGTIKVILENSQYEITTFRSESNYNDNRHPDSVTFSKNLLEDLNRRDFTINALVMNEKGEIKDYFNGRKDLENKIIRTIGNPEDRFKEDQLRKWRAIRFAAQNNFSIEPFTLEAIINNPDTSKVSIERIQDELNKILTSNSPVWGGSLLIKTKLLDHLLKRIGLNIKNRTFDDPLIPFSVIQNLSNNHLALKYSAFFLNFSEKDLKPALKNLRLPNKLAKETLSYLNAISRINNYNQEESRILLIKELINIVKKENMTYLFDLIISLEKLGILNKDLNFSELFQKAQDIIKNQEPLTIKELEINGNEIKELGFKNQEIKKVLDFLLTKVLINPELNKNSILIQIIKNEKSNLTQNN